MTDINEQHLTRALPGTLSGSGSRQKRMKRWVTTACLSFMCMMLVWAIMACFLDAHGLQTFLQIEPILVAVEYFIAFSLIGWAISLHVQFRVRMWIKNYAFKSQGRIVPHSARPYHLIRMARGALFFGLEMVGHALFFNLTFTYGTGFIGVAVVTLLYIIKDREKVVEQAKIWYDHVRSIAAPPGSASIFDLDRLEKEFPCKTTVGKPRWGTFIGTVTIIKAPLISASKTPPPDDSFLVNGNGKKLSRWGFAMTNDDCLKMVLFTARNSERAARANAESLLRTLTARYPGIAAKVSVHRLTETVWRKHIQVYEVQLPMSPFHGKIGILKQFTQVCFAFPPREFELYALWTQVNDGRAARIREKLMEVEEFDETQVEQHRASWHDDCFKLKLYIRAAHHAHGSDLRNSTRARDIAQVLGSVVPEVNSIKVKHAGIGTWRSIIHCHVHETYAPRGFLTPKMIDFTIVPDAPVHHQTETDLIIPLGMLRIDRQTTKMMKTIKLDNLSSHMLVAGGTGMGKNMFLFPVFNMAHEFIAMRGGGSCYFSFEKKDQQDYLYADVVFKFSVDCQTRQRPECSACKDFSGCERGRLSMEAPMLLELPGISSEPSIPNASSIITANLGLPEWYTKHVKTAMESRYRSTGHVQKDLKTLLSDLTMWHRLNPYGGEDQAAVTNALKSRTNDFCHEYISWMTRVLDRDSNIIAALKARKKVLVDLSECTSFETKHLIVLLILQSIRQRLPKSDNRTTLDYLICLDEAQEFLEDPDKTGRAREEILLRMMTETNKYTARMLKTDRGRGLGYIFITQSLTPLYESIYQNTMTKVFFKVTRECAEKVTRKAEDIDRIMEQGRREAFIDDGLAGEQYFITTLDYKPPSTRTSCQSPSDGPASPVVPPTNNEKTGSEQREGTA